MFCSPLLLPEYLSSNWVVALEVSLVCRISWKQKLLLKQMNAKQAPNMVLMITPPKTNMEPNNWWFVDDYPFPRGHFQVPLWFWGCTSLFLFP